MARCNSRLLEGLDRLGRRLGDACVDRVDIHHLVEGQPGEISATAQPPVSVPDFPELVVPDPGGGANPDICACISTGPDLDLSIPVAEVEITPIPEIAPAQEILLPTLEIASGEAEFPGVEISPGASADLTLPTGEPLVAAAPGAPDVFLEANVDIRMESPFLVIFESEAEAAAAGVSAP